MLYVTYNTGDGGNKMKNITVFGELLKELRISAGMTLREFCRKADEDPANLSRIERVLKTPPGDDVIARYAKALSLKEGTPEWRNFTDIAAISRREIPRDIADDAQLSAKLPALLRTARGEKPADKELDEIVNLTSKVFRP
jgi:transcriptional regulator with XRE-family HTH domain